MNNPDKIVSLADRRKLEQQMNSKEQASHNVDVAQESIIECLEILRSHSMNDTTPAVSTVQMHIDLGLKLNYAESLLRQAQASLKS